MEVFFFVHRGQAVLEGKIETKERKMEMYVCLQARYTLPWGCLIAKPR